VKGGAIAAEMESATLMTLGAIYGLRTGSIALIAINNDRPELGVITDVEPMISTAILAIKNLIKDDRKNKKES
jgi:uridine phosphorylase